MISQNTIDEVRQRLDIADVVGASVKLKKVGSELVGLCPFHNEKTPSFNVNPKKGLFHCKGCAVGGDAVKFVMDFYQLGFQAAIRKIAEIYHIEVKDDGGPIDYVRPQLHGGFVRQSSGQFFLDRGISPATVKAFNITEAVQWMPISKAEIPVFCFNFYRDGQLVNIKFRGVASKEFMGAKDAEPIFYNLDALKDQTYCYIVEGEIDALSLYEAGLRNVVSVPNGAATSDTSASLKYLDNCHGLFDKMESICICTDNDEPGRRLRDELARRLGKERCLMVDYPDGCKDANDVLRKEGIDGVLRFLKTAHEFPIEGIHEMDELIDDVQDYYMNGYPRGVRVGIPGFDDLLQFMPGQITTITGIPSSGKSEFIDNIMACAAKNHGWRFAVCSFENQPSSLHVSKLMEKFSGKAFAHRVDASMRMNHQEFAYAADMVRNHFSFININQVNVSLQGILDKARELVQSRGIHALLIDPWNYLEPQQNRNQTETQYISEALGKMKAFALLTGIHIFLVAHPTKIPKLNGVFEVPTLYNISGSAHFFNKTDNGICVYRNIQKGLVDVHVQKVRYSWLGKIGCATFNYNIETRQYEPQGTT